MAIIVVAADENGVIGNDSKIPWKLPDDMRFFKETTTGHSIIMGRKTWDSLPKKPLANRINYVISRQDIIPEPHCTIAQGLCGPIFCKSLEDALKDADQNEGKQIFIIGGAEIYKLALSINCVHKIILSSVKGKHEGDKFFAIPDNFKEVYREPREGFDVVHYLIF